MRDKHRKTPATRRTPPGGAAGDSGYRQGQGTSPHGGSSLSLRSMTSLQGEHNPYGRFLSNEDEDEMQIDYSEFEIKERRLILDQKHKHNSPGNSDQQYTHQNHNHYSSIRPEHHKAHSSQGENPPGINREEQERRIQDRTDEASNSLDQRQLYIRFEEHIDLASPLTEDEETALRMQTISEKWKLLFNEKTREPVYSWQFYIDELRQYLGRRRRLTTSHRKDENNHLTVLLRRLKLDLKMAYEWFWTEFLKAEGLELLVAVLRDIQHSQATLSMMTTKKAKHHEMYKRYVIEEFDCVLCIKLASRADGMIRLLGCPNAVETVSVCHMSSFPRTRVLALEMMILFCETTDGYQQVMDAMTMIRIRFGESVRFKMLVGMLNSQGDNQIRLQGMCVRFFNKLLSSTDNDNAKVYLQHELGLAGFDPDLLDKYMGDSLECNDLHKELELWRKNYIDVQSTNQNVHSLENRNALLRREVDLLQAKIKELEKDNKNEVDKIEQLNDRCEEYRERAAELQDTVEKLQDLYKTQTGKDAGKDVYLDEVLAPLDMPPETKTLAANKYDTVTSTKSQASSQGSQGNGTENRPLPPPLPPPLFLSRTVRKKVVPGVNLPFLNWTPLNNVESTIFQDIDDEEFLRDIDFGDFEDKFHLPIKKESAATKNKRQKQIESEARKIRFIDYNRAKNLIITKRGTMLTSRQIREYIDDCNIEHFSGEFAEILIKFVPTKDELKLLAQNALNYKDMGEAEQMMFQMAQVERLQSKLGVLGFMGIFKELMLTLRPKIQFVLRASLSLLQSKKLKKVLEVILAFGNYMNSCKRGYTFGYKVESLYKLKDVRSTDKSQTLLHYLAKLMKERYSHLMDFYEDLDVTIDKGDPWAGVDRFVDAYIPIRKTNSTIWLSSRVSYQAISADVQGLRKGLDLVKYEREKQPNNHTLQTFYKEASGEVAEIAETFHKMEDAYQKACAMFKENYKTTEPDEFFKTFADFVAEFVKAAQENFIRETSVLLKSSTLPANKKSLKHSTEGSKDQTTNNANDSQIPYSFQNGRSRSESNLIDRTSSQVGHKRPFQVNIIKPTESEPHLQNNVSAKSNSNGSSNQQNRPIYDEVQPESSSSSNQSQEITDQTEDKKEQIKNINLHYRISSRKEKQLGGGGQERRTQEEKHRRVLADISQLRKDRPKRTPSKPEHSNWVLRNSSGKVRQPTEENGQSLGKRSSPNADRVYSKANDNANIYDSIGDKGSRPNPRNETVSNGEVYHLRSRSDSEARQIDLALNELDRVLDENSFTSTHF